MPTHYRRSNPYSRYCSVAEAAIAWQGLAPEQQDLVVVDDDGVPYLAGTPELSQRARAIVEAVHCGEIDGAVHTESGYYHATPLRMQLLRDSAAAWLAEANRRLASPAPSTDAPLPPLPMQEQLLTTEQVCQALGCSRSTLNRRLKERTFPAKLEIGGRSKWPASVVAAYVAGRARTTNGVPAASTEENI
jgi:predicted DNA-binding transcriptional regulator AlpA